jgi:hypothetical protein
VIQPISRWNVRAASLGAMLVVALLALITVPAASDPAPAAIDKINRLVVMMTVTKSDGSQVFGAGVIFGSNASRVYVMTARHVLVQASDIQVLFRDLPGEPFAAQQLAFASSTLGDLAVVAVALSPELQRAVGALAFDAAGDSDDDTGSLQSGADVYLLGDPLHVPWHLSGPPPAKVTTPDAVSINYSADRLDEGYSGGALLNSCGQIVGLISGDSGVTGTAMKYSAVRSELTSQTYPITLSRPSTGCLTAAAQPPIVLPPARMVFVTQNNSNVHCDNAPTCSPDGKWRSTVTTLTIQAQSGAHLINSKLSCDGPGGACQFCDTPGPLVSGTTTATITVRCWSLPVTLTLQADQVT